MAILLVHSREYEINEKDEKRSWHCLPDCARATAGLDPLGANLLVPKQDFQRRSQASGRHVAPEQIDDLVLCRRPIGAKGDQYPVGNGVASGVAKDEARRVLGVLPDDEGGSQMRDLNRVR